MIPGFPRVGRICIGSLVTLSVTAAGNVPGSRVHLESLHADDGQSPNAGNRLAWTAYDYDAAGRVAVRRSSDGGRTDTGYYPCGIVRTTLDDAGLSVTNRINALGNNRGHVSTFNKPMLL